MFVIEMAAAAAVATGAATAEVAKPVAPTVVVTLQRDGFAPTCVVGAAAGGEELRLAACRLTRLSTQVKIDAADGGVVTDAPTRTVFSIPPSAFLSADGCVYAGPVTISVATIDPSDKDALAAMPGDFSALTIDGDEGALRSFGAYYFSATDEHGAELGLNAHAPVSVEWPLSVQLDTCDKGVPPPCAWSLDAATGKWMQHPAVPLEVDGVRLPAPGTAEFVALGEPAQTSAVETSAEEAQAPARFRGVKKGKGGPLGPRAEARNNATIADAVRAILEGSASVKSLKQLHIPFGGWCNIDSMLANPKQLPCLLRGRLANWSDVSAPWRSQQIVAVGVDYASRTRAKVQLDGAFELAVQPNSIVTLQVEADVQLVPDAAEGDTRAELAPDLAQRKKTLCEFADVVTGKALSATELGELRM